MSRKEIPKRTTKWSKVIEMKRTCKGCKAVSSQYGLCYLGYATKTKYKHGFINEVIPSENCPKPMTHREYVELDHKRRYFNEESY